MDMPPPLRQAVDRALHGVALAELSAAAAALSERYRAEQPTGVPHVTSRRDALAYLAVRMPATHAAVRASLDAVAQACPSFAPRTLLDAGAGPGTALWAAAGCWSSLADAVLVEASAAFRACGDELAVGAHLPRIEWRAADLTAGGLDGEPRDLVTLAYVLNELPSGARAPLLERLWRATAGLLVVVEPGTPAGWQSILAVRRQLLEQGAHVIAPCPHAQACPLERPDWCHFAARVARSRLHRQAKDAAVPWEDEKFCYVALSREPAPQVGARVIARPRKASGRVTLKLCRPDGAAGEQLFSRRNGAAYKRAARSDWGDTV
jgi:ribosomal protein RSM22 (predicted rRNA methylase)